MLSDGTRTYAWDAENRLVKITHGTLTTDLEYDGLHRWTRILEKNGSTTVSDRRFVWSVTQLIEQRNGTATSAVQRFFAEGVQQGSNLFSYTRDHLGSIREVTNSSGAVVARYDYDPYGRRTKVSGSFDSDFGYTGHYHHAPSGLALAPYRMYSAELGRWLSRDPIGEAGGLNLFSYVGNNPVNFLDPLGLCRVGDRKTKSVTVPRFSPRFHGMLLFPRLIPMVSIVDWYDCKRDYICVPNPMPCPNTTPKEDGVWMADGPDYDCQLRPGGWL